VREVDLRSGLEPFDPLGRDHYLADRLHLVVGQGSRGRGGVDRAFAVGAVGLWAGDLVLLGLDHAVTS
jgi:hypothetical protein